MSNLNDFTSAIEQPVVGEVVQVSTGGPVPPGYLACDGSILSQAAYPTLYGKVGLIPNSNNFLQTLLPTQSFTSSSISALTYGNNLYVYGGTSGILGTSTDAITWTARTSGTTTNINALIYGNGVYVRGGVGGALGTSTDGITWTARTSGTVSPLSALTYGGGLYVYGGTNGALGTSTDGVTWTARTSGTTLLINALTYGGGLYVRGGSAGSLGTSTDGITWTARTSGTTSSINGLLYANNLYYYVCHGGVVGTSTDAITWTARSIGMINNNNLFNLTYVANTYILAGTGCFITSTNAVLWTPIYFPNRTPAIGNLTGPLAASNKVIVVAAGARLGYMGIYTYNPDTEFALPLTNQINSTSLYIRAS